MKAGLMWRIGRLDEARILYLKSYDLGGRKFKPILKDLAFLEKDALNFSKMREYAEEFLKTKEDKRIYQMLAVSLSHDLKDFKSAENYFKKALYENPSNIIQEHHNVATYHAMAVNLKNQAISRGVDKTTKRELLDKAIQCCSKGIKLEKSNMRCYELVKECELLKEEI